MTHKFVVMDYSTCEIHIFDYNPNDWDSEEDFLCSHYSEHGQTFKESQCNWMTIELEEFEKRLPIYIH